MQYLVYETAVEYESSGQFLGDIRQAVQDLKREDPRLHHYSLADFSVQKGKRTVNVKLYFQPKN
ncbi:MAG TPA: hypothetical protein GX014_03590 [Firmicutes bacterium]|jgi:hypothetical protein|nr:hypothetical protein [Bacillota bacterium]NMB02616.1 hypothetical protein [Bacillota bacterium]HHT42464.1 hypothetical protein [Bacillota bacterium]